MTDDDRPPTQTQASDFLRGLSYGVAYGIGVGVLIGFAFWGAGC